MKILVIEDDRDTSAYVAKGLEQQGHVVDVTYDGKDGLFLASSESYDLMVVDRMLPSIDGLTIVKTVRGAGSKVPIIFLTTMGSIDDRVDGLESGGDDYLVKPFAFSELLARVNALARRPPLTQNETFIRIGSLEMDLIHRTVRRGGQEIVLRPLEFRILELFMRNEGRIITRTMLLERIWDFHFDPKTKVVEANVSRLRIKLDKPFKQPLLKTVRGLGYVLQAGGAQS